MEATRQSIMLDQCQLVWLCSTTQLSILELRMWAVHVAFKVPNCLRLVEALATYLYKSSPAKLEYVCFIDASRENLALSVLGKCMRDEGAHYKKCNNININYTKISYLCCCVTYQINKLISWIRLYLFATCIISV